MIKIETIDFDTIEGFLTTFKDLPKKAMNTKYIIEKDTLQTYAVYISYSKRGNKTFLIKAL